MARKVLDNYPEFLKDFEEIAVLAKSHEKGLTTLKSRTESMLKELKVSDYFNNMWMKVTKWDDYESNLQKKYAQKFFKKHEVTKVEDVKHLIETVTGKEKFTLSFSADTLTFTVKSTQEFNKKQKKRAREVVPANMELEFLVAEEL